MDKKLIIVYYGRMKPELTKLDFLRWWEDQEILAAELGLKLTHVMGSFKEIRHKLTQHKGYRLPGSRKRIEREIEDGNVESLGLTSLITKSDGSLMYDWDFDALFGKNPTCDMISVTGVDTRHLKKKSRRFTQNLIGRTYAHNSLQLEMNYGFSAVMDWNFLPTGYAVGMASEMPEYFVHDGYTWRQYAGKVCDRRLRNVFGYNIINRLHLDIQVGSQRLQEWISESPDRGIIEDIGEGLFAWTFAKNPEDTKFLDWNYPAVEKVRRELEKFSIFPWQEVEA